MAISTFSKVLWQTEAHLSNYKARMTDEVGETYFVLVKALNIGHAIKKSLRYQERWGWKLHGVKSV